MCAGVQQSPGQMRVLHIAQSPQGARPAGTPQMPQQQRMVNLSAYGRPGGELKASNPQTVSYPASWPCVQSSISGWQKWNPLLQACHNAWHHFVHDNALVLSGITAWLSLPIPSRSSQVCGLVQAHICTYAGPSPQSSPGLLQLQMGQARPPAGAASAPHQPWQALLHPGHLGSSPGGPRPGGVMFSAPPGGPSQPPQSAGQHPVNIRFSNYSGEHQHLLVQSCSPAVICGNCSLAGVCVYGSWHFVGEPRISAPIMVARRRQHTCSLDGEACASCMHHVNNLISPETVGDFCCRPHHADPAFQQCAPRQHAAAYPGSPLPCTLIRRHGRCRCAHQLCFRFASCLQIYVPIDSGSFTLERRSCPCIM